MTQVVNFVEVIGVPIVPHHLCQQQFQPVYDVPRFFVTKMKSVKTGWCTGWWLSDILSKYSVEPLVKTISGTEVHWPPTFQRQGMILSWHTCRGWSCFLGFDFWVRGTQKWKSDRHLPKRSILTDISSTPGVKRVKINPEGTRIFQLITPGGTRNFLLSSLCIIPKKIVI